MLQHERHGTRLGVSMEGMELMCAQGHVLTPPPFSGLTCIHRSALPCKPWTTDQLGRILGCSQ